MMSAKPFEGLTIFLIVFGVLILITILIIISLPLILKFCCQKRKHSRNSKDLEQLLQPTEQMSRKESISEQQIRRISSISRKNTDIDCTVEYRTRGTQLIIGITNVTPAINSLKLKNESYTSQVFLLVYIDGDSLNSPCQSTKHAFTEKILFNEIFIFTAMPYDLATLNLIVQTVLVCGNWKYNIGTLTLPLTELDQTSYAIKKVQSVPYPNERSLIQECLLSLSIMKCKNTIKLKFLKLYFLDSSSKEQPFTGLHLRTQITDFQNPLQTFETTKKKYQQCITFNELTMFQFENPINNSLELEVQLLESNNTDVGEQVSVCGRTVLYIIQDEETSGNPTVKNGGHLLEVVNNPDVEIVRWHPIPYVKSNS